MNKKGLKRDPKVFTLKKSHQNQTQDPLRCRGKARAEYDEQIDSIGFAFSVFFWREKKIAIFFFFFFFSLCRISIWGTEGSRSIHLCGGAVSITLLSLMVQYMYILYIVYFFHMCFSLSLSLSLPLSLSLSPPIRKIAHIK
jgi:hypothetical protein